MASSSSSHQEPDSELEKKQDQFNRLPDDLVLLIFNKPILFHAKTLIRLSLVSKRFFSLVSQTHSVFVVFDCRKPSFLRRLGGFLGNMVTKAMRTLTTPSVPNSDNNDNNNNSPNLYAILQRFQQIKHLHVHLCFNSSPGPGKPFESDAFFYRCVVALGSHFEFCHMLIATSVYPISKPSVAAAGNGNGIELMQGLNDGQSERVLKLLRSLLNNASTRHDMFREHVLEPNLMLESYVFSDDQLGKVIMGKEQIARLRSRSSSSHGGNSNQGISKVRVLACYVPTLDLVELGYTMEYVIFVRVIAVNQNSDDHQENVAVPVFDAVEVMDAADPEDVEVMAAENVQVMNVPVLDHSDFKHWQVFDESFRLLLDKIKVKNVSL